MDSEVFNSVENGKAIDAVFKAARGKVGILELEVSTTVTHDNGIVVAFKTPNRNDTVQVLQELVHLLSPVRALHLSLNDNGLIVRIFGHENGGAGQQQKEEDQ